MDITSFLSGPLGALFGAAGGLAAKILDYKDAGNKRAHELALRDKEKEFLAMELANKSEISKVEADQQISFREFDTFAGSLASDKATYGDSFTGRIVDLIRGLIRPIITTIAMCLVVYTTLKAMQGDPLPIDERMKILNESMFLAGTAISWWFGSRGLSQQRKK